MNARGQVCGMAAVAVLALTMGACSSTEDQGFAGTYVGDAIDSQDSSNRKEFTLTLDAAGTAVSGTYRIKAILLDVHGIVDGTLNVSEVELALTPSAQSDCPYRVNGVWIGERIVGTYAAFNCWVRSDGTLELKKQ